MALPLHLPLRKRLPPSSDISSLHPHPLPSTAPEEAALYFVSGIHYILGPFRVFFLTVVAVSVFSVRTGTPSKELIL